MAEQKKAFTLVELLVVIAIIALLMGILLPALSRARDQAYTIICRTNLKNLALGWIMYVDDSDGYLVEGETGWVKHTGGGIDFLKREKEDIKAGDLWPYIKNFDVYRCRADRAMREEYIDETTRVSPMFRSYAIPGGMNGKHGKYLPGIEVEKFSEIRAPATKYVFLEEDHVGVGNNNWGSWILNPRGDSWWDGMAIRHNKKACLSFADGHAEIQTWVDKSTIVDMGQLHRQGVKPAQNEGQDLKYMQDGYELRVYSTN